jgi:hypothetical protein
VGKMWKKELCGETVENNNMGKCGKSGKNVEKRIMRGNCGKDVEMNTVRKVWKKCGKEYCEKSVENTWKTIT